MDLEKVAHDITISLLPRALDRDVIHNEWQDISGQKVNVGNEEIEMGERVEMLNASGVVMNYRTIYAQVLEALKN